MPKLDLINNIEQRNKFIEIFVKEYNAKCKPEDRITIEDMNANLTDQSKMEKHNRACKIVETEQKKVETINNILAENNIKKESNKLDRVIKSEIDLSGTPEAQKHNLDVAKMAYNSVGVYKYSQIYMQRIADSKPKDLIPEVFDFDHAIDKLEQYGDIYYDGFALVDIEKTGQMTSEMSKYYNKNRMVIQGYGSMASMLEIMSSQAYLFIPDKVFFNLDMANEASSLMNSVYNSFNDYFCEEINKNNPDEKPVISAFNQDEKDTIVKCGANIANASIAKVENEFISSQIRDEKVKAFDNNILCSGYFTIDGNEITGSDLYEALRDKDKNIEYHKYTEAERKEISQLTNNGFYSSYQKNKDGEYVFKPTSVSEISDYYNNKFKTDDFKKQSKQMIASEKKTNSFFSLDSSQYKEMDKKIKELGVFIDNFNKSSDEKSQLQKKLGTKEFRKHFLSASELANKMKEAKEFVDKYIEKKEKDEKAKKINSNGRKRLEMARNLSKFLNNSVEIEEKIVTNDGVKKYIPSENKAPTNENRVKANSSMVEKLENEVDKSKGTKEVQKQVGEKQQVIEIENINSK